MGVSFLDLCYVDYRRRAFSRSIQVAFRSASVRGYAQVSFVAVTSCVASLFQLAYCL